jgi:hypothetical protein
MPEDRKRLLIIVLLAVGMIAGSFYGFSQKKLGK